MSDVSEAKSPVSGAGWKKSLSPEYKKIKGEQSSSNYANMELTGAMLDSLTYKIKGDDIEIGIFDEDEAQKADNHNKFSPESKKTNVPARKFIPNKDENESFKRYIMTEVRKIIKENKDGTD